MSGSSAWETVGDVNAGTVRMTFDEGEEPAAYTVRAMYEKDEKLRVTKQSPSVSDAEKKYTEQTILFVGDSITKGYPNGYPF